MGACVYSLNTVLFATALGVLQADDISKTTSIPSCFLLRVLLMLCNSVEVIYPMSFDSAVCPEMSESLVGYFCVRAISVDAVS